MQINAQNVLGYLEKLIYVHLKLQSSSELKDQKKKNGDNIFMQKLNTQSQVGKIKILYFIFISLLWTRLSLFKNTTCI